MSLKKGYSWFKKKLSYHGPKDANRPWILRIWRYSVNKGSSYRFPKLSRDNLLGIRAKYADSTQALEDHYQGRFRAIEAAYKKVFEGFPFCLELGKREKQALLTQIAKDNKFPMIVSKLAIEKGKLLVKTVPSISAAAKAASPSKTSMPDSDVPLFLSSSVEKLGTRKRYLPKESVSGGDVGQIQPDIAQSKRARTSPAKTLKSTTIPSPPSSPLEPVASSSPIPSVGEVLLKEPVGAGEVEPYSERAQTWISASVVLK
ncbi:hypothetical protein L3X38_026919 [Prunus dulcis]|uniref:Uncharacterized protein n=1 Tax=Prunus dulcis TaxID=3755 RepID=A0AAD4VN66_PRUDU|nr:hypothetical protein L3X38_026919 [Prunus dulcis]